MPAWASRPRTTVSSRRAGIVLGPPHRDASVRLAQFSRALDALWCAAFSRVLVLGKARAQVRLLRSALEERPDMRKPLFDAIASVETCLGALEADSACGLERIRGLEGACAAAYLSGYRALFAESLGFRNRNRRPPRDPVNAALSLAYTLLHFDAVRAAHVAGLDPMIGFYHQTAHGRESLACDLIEPLRPRADAFVRDLFRERTLRPEHFAIDKGACLLGKAGRERFYAAWEGHASVPRRWLRRQCASLAASLRQSASPMLDGSLLAAESEDP
jgi:CRISPR-associated protein Cas1